MHPALRKNYQIKNDVIWFEHKKQLVKDFGNEPIPRFVNSGSNIEQTIELLGSANIILTNSYHGAYWGTLLGKKVIVVGVWGAKFYAFRHKPYILEKNESWQEAVDKVMIHPNALDECIASTENFWNSIKSR
jgi:exopolysaccharide biosynthesis predicted pyruvyltransferase EpsI